MNIKLFPHIICLHLHVKITNIQIEDNRVVTLIYINNKQESPPAWTQEAYRPPCSKCSLCWWGRGYPIQSRGGYPIQSWWGGTLGTPTIQNWLGKYPIQSWWGGGYPGYPPPSRPGMGHPPPSDLGWGIPPPSDLGCGTPTIIPGMGYPPHHQTWDGVPPTIRPGMGYPPPPSDLEWGTPSPHRWWTDRHSQV